MGLLLRGACSHQTFYNICLKLTSRSFCSISNWKPQWGEMRRYMYRGRALIHDATHWLTFPLTLKHDALRYIVLNRTVQLANRDAVEIAGKKKSPWLVEKSFLKSKTHKYIVYTVCLIFYSFIIIIHLQHEILWFYWYAGTLLLLGLLEFLGRASGFFPVWNLITSNVCCCSVQI